MLIFTTTDPLGNRRFVSVAGNGAIECWNQHRVSMALSNCMYKRVGSYAELDAMFRDAVLEALPGGSDAVLNALIAVTGCHWQQLGGN